MNIPSPFTIRLMTLEDYEEVYALWAKAEGLCLGKDDSREGIAQYLKRNPAFCFVALSEPEIAGVILAGHDGRCAMLHHLAVRLEYRRKGIAVALVAACREALCAEGIQKCQILVRADNPAALKFWAHQGFKPLAADVVVLEAGQTPPCCDRSH